MRIRTYVVTLQNIFNLKCIYVLVNAESVENAELRIINETNYLSKYRMINTVLARRFIK